MANHSGSADSGLHDRTSYRRAETVRGRCSGGSVSLWLQRAGQDTSNAGVAETAARIMEIMDRRKVVLAKLSGLLCFPALKSLLWDTVLC